MSKPASPWMKFYPQDWRADEKLRMCSLAARGLWIEMLAIMHRSERYGQLLIGGQVPTDAQLAVQVGASPPEVSEMIGQLEAAGVFSRAGSGAIYSRRMTRDHRKAEIARKNGKSGGNPSLLKQRGNPQSDNPSVKGEDKPQRPEARVSDDKSSGVPPDNLVKALFDTGVAILTADGMEASPARQLVASLRKKRGDLEAAKALEESRSKTKPAEFLWACVHANPGGDLLEQANRYRRKAA